MQGTIYSVGVTYGENNAEWILSSDVTKDMPDVQGSDIYAEYKGIAVQQFVTRYYSEIEDYRETVVDGKYTSVPTKKGYVFAGWYTDETCATPLTTATTSGDACAKFVDEKILTVKAQAKYTANSDEQKIDLRFVTTVDELNFKEVGFIVTNRSGIEKSYAEQYVYSSLNAAGVTYAPKDQFSQYSTRFATIQMTGVTIEDTDKGISDDRNIPVKAYWITKDGSIVCGKARNVNVAEAVSVIESATPVVISVD